MATGSHSGPPTPKPAWTPSITDVFNLLNAVNEVTLKRMEDEIKGINDVTLKRMEDLMKGINEITLNAWKTS